MYAAIIGQNMLIYSVDDDVIIDEKVLRIPLMQNKTNKQWVFL